jgi:hypothetical protein
MLQMIARSLGSADHRLEQADDEAEYHNHHESTPQLSTSDLFSASLKAK